MTYSIFQKISDKLFTPGSPDSLLSPENGSNLRIAAAFIKACVGSSFPCLLNKTASAIQYDGSEWNYRGFINNNQPYGRGILYQGPLLKPTSLSIGNFLPSGRLKEGYCYNQNGKVTSHIGVGRDNLTFNIKGPDGLFVRGVLPWEDTPNRDKGFNIQELIPFEKKGFPRPLGGGEVNAWNSDGFFLQGTFSTNRTFTGSISHKGNQNLQKGVFSFKESSNSILELKQLSGTKELLLEDGIKLQVTLIPNSNQLEGVKIAPDESVVAKGIFLIVEEDGLPYITQVSGTYSVKFLEAPAIFDIIDETTARGRCSSPDGFFMEGVFYRKGDSMELSLKNLLSGTFRLPNGPEILEGKVLSGSETWEGTCTNCNGSFKKGVFSLDNRLFSGTFKEILEDESVLEGVMFPSGAGEGKITFSRGSLLREATFLTRKKPEETNFSYFFKELKYKNGTVLKAQEGILLTGSSEPFEGSIHYPNGDYKTGLLTRSYTTEGDTSYCFLSGAVKVTYPDGRVFEGTDGDVMQGIVRYPDGREEYVVA